MKLLIVQPHQDDAVWSIAEHMLTWMENGHELVVLTTHNGRVPRRDFMRHRKHDILDLEHHDVMVAMGIHHWIQLDHPDDGWGPEYSHSAAAIGAEIRWKITRVGPDVIVCPTGIHHPDHRTCRFAVYSAYLDGGPAVWFYDELPYYVLHPQLACGPGLYQPAVYRDHFDRKKELVKMYKSQWAPHLERTVYAPERVWVP